MADGNQGTALTRSQQFSQDLEQQARNFQIMLPQHVPLEKFKRVVVTAVIQDPKLFNADRRSLFMAAQKCASDGLLPDGREAVLLPFNTRVKRKLEDGTQQDVWTDLVQYIPMIQGIRQRMRNSGQVASAEAYVVHRNDKFFQKFGSDPQIVHEPPALGAERGEPVGAYAIIRLKSGEVIQEVMDFTEIERIRSFSKAKDGPAWRNHWGEMARKTVLRRAAKAAPTSAEIAELMSRDDEEPDANYVDLPAMEPEPQRQIGGGQPEEEPSYLVVDADGEEHEYRTAEAATSALAAVLRDARRRGRASLEAMHENNAAVVRSLPSDLRAELGPFGLPPLSDKPASTADYGKLFRALEPPRADLASEEPDWHRYAEGMIELIGRADAATIAATLFSNLPHMKALRLSDGGEYRRVMDAVRDRAAQPASAESAA